MSAEPDMAFDVTRDWISGGSERRARRERIATAALQGLLSNPAAEDPDGAPIHCTDPRKLSARALQYADALIAELDKPEAAQ